MMQFQLHINLNLFLPGQLPQALYAYASAVPQIPKVIPIAPSTPRAAASTRVHDVHSDEESNDAKRARVESAKKQRLNRISQEYSAQIRAVKIADDVFHTMDGYQSDLRLDDHDMDDEEIASGALPKELWSDNPLGQKPDDPSHEIDLLADQVELVRLCEMKVIGGG